MVTFFQVQLAVSDTPETFYGDLLEVDTKDREGIVR